MCAPRCKLRVPSLCGHRFVVMLARTHGPYFWLFVGYAALQAWIAALALLHHPSRSSLEANDDGGYVVSWFDLSLAGSCWVLMQRMQHHACQISLKPVCRCAHVNACLHQQLRLLDTQPQQHVTAVLPLPFGQTRA